MSADGTTSADRQCTSCPVGYTTTTENAGACDLVPAVPAGLGAGLRHTCALLTDGSAPGSPPAYSATPERLAEMAKVLKDWSAIRTRNYPVMIIDPSGSMDFPHVSGETREPITHRTNSYITALPAS